MCLANCDILLLSLSFFLDGVNVMCRSSLTSFLHADVTSFLSFMRCVHAPRAAI